MISTIDGFDVQKNGAIDFRYVVADQTARLALTWVYKGLLCYQVSTNSYFKYKGTPPSNVSGDWDAVLDAGTPGTPGSVWFNGSGAPSSGTGIVGDYYLDNTTDDVYNKTGVSTWTLITNIKGAQGSPGQDPSFGSIAVTGGATAQGLTGTYAKITQFTANGAASTDVTPDHTNDDITLTSPGDYFLYFHGDLIGIATKIYDLAIYVDGVITELKTTVDTTADTNPDVSFMGVINIPGSSAVIELYAKQTSGGTHNLTLVTARLGITAVNVAGQNGTVGNAIIHTEHDITLDDAKVTAVQGGSWTPQAPWSASVLADSRSNLSVPSGITGNKVDHSIAYDGSAWYDNGIWRGPSGANGLNGTNANVSITGTNGVNVSSTISGPTTYYTIQETVPTLISSVHNADMPDRLNYADFGSASFNIRLGIAKGGTVVWVAGKAGNSGVVQGINGCGVSYDGTLYTSGNTVSFNTDRIYSFVAIKQTDGVGNWTIMVPCRYVNPPVTSVNGFTGAVVLTIPSLTDLTPANAAKQNTNNNLSTVGGPTGSSLAYSSVTYISTAYVIPCINISCTIYRGAADLDCDVFIQGSYNNSTWTTLKKQTVRIQNGLLYQANITVVDKTMAIAGVLVYYRCLVTVTPPNTVQVGNAADHTIYGVLKGGS